MQEQQALDYHFTAITEGEKRRSVFDRYVWIIYLVWLIAGIIANLVSGFHKVYITLVWPAIALIGTAFNIYERKKSGGNYLIINNYSVEWFLPGFTRKEGFDWNDLKWVKFEKSGIQFFRASSFSRFLPYASFTWDDQEVMKRILGEEIIRRNIKMISE